MIGIHIVRKRLRWGDRYYSYAWRGGPLIQTDDHVPPVITQKLLAKQLAAMNKDRDEKTVRMSALITAYQDSPEFGRLKPATKKDYRLWLNRIDEHFGKMPLELFNDAKMRGKVHGWRNQWRDQPRSADKGVVMMSTLLNWGRENAMVDHNCADGISKLHRVNKADEIWEERHWDAIHNAKIPTHVMDAIVLASLTGLRLGDLVKLEWGNVNLDQNFVWVERTEKRGTEAIIPMLPELRAWLKGREQTGTVLKNSRGFAWTKQGLSCMLRKSFPPGFDRVLHDLRGTFATKLVQNGLNDDDIAKILGWSSEKVSAVRLRYVDNARVIMHLAQKMRGMGQKTQRGKVYKGV